MKVAITTIIFGLYLAALPAHSSQNAALYELIDALHKNGTIDAETHAAIRATADGDNADGVASTASGPVTREWAHEGLAVAVREQPKIDTRGKFEVSSADDDFKFRIGGRLHVDGALHNDDGIDHGDDFEMRRARVLLLGTMWRHWHYKLDYDFTVGGSRGIADGYISYSGLGHSEIRVGHLKEPFSLQNMMSTNNINFTERSLPFALTALRNIGTSVHSGSTHWSAAIGLYGSGIGEPAGDIDQSYGTSGRMTYAPWLTDNQLVHIGASLAYRNVDQNKSLALSTRPESFLSDTLVTTGTFPADSLYRYGLEAAAVHNNLSLQGEYIGLEVQRTGGLSDVGFNGYYMEASWFLTGETPNYSGKDGVFKVVKPNRLVGQGGIGAWQMALRFSHLDLNDGPISGGSEDNLTFGLNWYPVPNLRFMANYINVLSVKGGPTSADEPDIFALRGQVVF